MKGLSSIVLLIISNVFMTYAWYGHLQMKDTSWVHRFGIFGIILLSWGIAFFEYVFQVPANRLGYEQNGGPFNMFELKIIQEVISLTVFSVFAVLIFRTDKLQWNYIAGFACMILAVFFIFRKW